MATRRHEIPTPLDVEDKAFLGLSIRQVMILVTGASLGYGLYGQWPDLPFALRAAAAVACLLGTLVLALVRPGGRGLEDWAFVALHFLATPRASVSRPREPEARDGRPAGAGWVELAPRASWRGRR